MRLTSADSASLLSCGELRRVVDIAAKRGLRVTAKTAIRWTTGGRRGVRLPSLRIGEGRCTTAAAFDAWLLAVAAAESEQLLEPTVGIDSAAAERVLEAHGLGGAAK